MPNTLPEAVQAELRARGHVVTINRGGVGGVALIGIDSKTKQATAVGPAADKIHWNEPRSRVCCSTGAGYSELWFAEKPHCETNFARFFELARRGNILRRPSWTSPNHVWMRLVVSYSRLFYWLAAEK